MFDGSINFSAEIEKRVIGNRATGDCQVLDQNRD